MTEKQQSYHLRIDNNQYEKLSNFLTEHSLSLDFENRIKDNRNNIAIHCIITLNHEDAVVLKLLLNTSFFRKIFPDDK